MATACSVHIVSYHRATAHPARERLQEIPRRDDLSEGVFLCVFFHKDSQLVSLKLTNLALSNFYQLNMQFGTLLGKGMVYYQFFQVSAPSDPL